MSKITRKHYSLLEVFAVMAVLAVISSLMLSSLYRFRKDYLNFINDAPRAREIPLIRQQMNAATHRLNGPLTVSGGEIRCGGEVAAELAGTRLRLRGGDGMRSVALPPRMTAELTVIDAGRALVLTLTPQRSSERSFRIVSAVGGKEVAQ